MSPTPAETGLAAGKSFVTAGRNARSRKAFLLIALVTAVLYSGRQCRAEDQPAPAKKSKAAAREESPFPQRDKVPQGIFDGGKEWLNASGPISVRDLKGKIVIVDFWTYCCINCMHVLPELKAIEKKFPNEVVVLGVHSAKFENEKETENIRRAIQRYEIEHPVVNDADMAIWERFGVRAWPTLVFIDPEGYLLGSASGESERQMLETVVGKLIEYHKKKGTLDSSPVHFQLEREKLKATPLRFPGKLLADEEGNRLFVSDSNHNRIVVSTLDGKLLDVIGSGAQSAVDGSFDKAGFNHPQGMAIVGDTLYVADTENHLIRSIDLKVKTVSTLAGTGKQGRRGVYNWKLRETGLNSPWALLHHDGALYVAMAGPHQIWRHELGSDTIKVFAGSGAEDVVDGPAADAAFAQPSDIVSDGTSLYVNDSEGSSIRKVSLDKEPKVSTVVGTAHLERGRLFEFGDIDGLPPKVRFQHPIGLAIQGNALYVADSYNHKIRRVNLTGKPGETTTVLGDGKPGDSVDPPKLNEPEGVAVAGGKLYVADTNNHRILAMNLITKQVSDFQIAGLKPPAPPTDDVAPRSPTETAIETPPLSVAGKSLKFEVALVLPDDFKLNKLAPLTYRIAAGDGQKLLAADQLGKRHKAESDGTTATFTLPLAATSGKATLDVSLTYGYCRDGVGGLCKIKTERWKIPVELSAGDGEATVKLTSDATK